MRGILLSCDGTLAMRTRIFSITAYLLLRRPILVIAIAFLFAALSGIYAVRDLHLNADTNDLISPNRPFMVRYRQFIEEFGDLEYIYVVVASNGHTDKAERAVDSLVGGLRGIPELPQVYGGIEPDEQLHIATRAMPIDDLRRLVQVRAAIAVLTNKSNDTNQTASTAAGFLDRLRSKALGMSENERELIGASAVFLLDLLTDATRRAVRDSAGIPAKEAKESPSLRPLFDSPATTSRPEYLKSETGQLYFIEVMPSKDFGTLAIIEKPIENIRIVIDHVRSEFPEVDIGLTGLPVLQADEMLTSNRDMTRAAVSAFLVCTVLFIVFIGGIKRPLLAVVAFLCGAAWTFGLTTLLLGQLNLLSNVFILVLVGVGLDYGVHVIVRYREIRATRPIGEALDMVMQTAVRGNVTGAMTSGIAFFAAWFTSFQGLRELGMIAGFGLLLCLAAMSVLLPALLVVADRGLRFHRAKDHDATNESVHDPFAFLQFAPKHPLVTFACCGVLSLIIAFLPGSLRFESNLLELQAEGLEAVQWEKRIAADSSAASWFGAVVVDDLESVKNAVIRAEAFNEVGRVSSILDVMALPTREREDLREVLQRPHGSKIFNDVKPFDVDRAEHLIVNLKAIAEAAKAAGQMDEAEHLENLTADVRQYAAYWVPPLDASDVRLTEVRQNVDARIQAVSVRFKQILAGNNMALREALPAALRAQYMSESGRYLVMAHPRENVWDLDAMKRFVTDLKAIDANATGVPFTHIGSLEDMRSSFVWMSIFAVVGILILLGVDFRGWRDVILAVIPLAVGVLWTLQIMAFFDVSFNLANFFALPIIIGLSVDAGVHLLHRYHEGGPNRLNPGATRRAVILTGLTTIIGFGSLVFAHHRGLQSLGLVMVIGISSCLLAALIVLPAVLSLHDTKRDASDLKE